MPYNVLILPLLGGFLFFHITHYFRFSAQRLDGYRLLLQTAVAGACLAFLARIINVSLEIVFGQNLVDRLWHSFLPFSFSGVGSLALVLGPVAGLVWNLFVNVDEAKDIEIRKHGNSLTKLLHRAQKENLLVSVTLHTRKWYVGWVAESPNLDPQEMYFRLLPFTSGYRDTDTLEAVRTVFYDAALRVQEIDLNDLRITLPIQDVAIANLFNEDLYNDYFASPEPGDEPEPSHRHRT